MNKLLATLVVIIVFVVILSVRDMYQDEEEEDYLSTSKTIRRLKKQYKDEKHTPLSFAKKKYKERFGKDNEDNEEKKEGSDKIGKDEDKTGKDAHVPLSGNFQGVPLLGDYWALPHPDDDESVEDEPVARRWTSESEVMEGDNAQGIQEPVDDTPLPTVQDAVQQLQGSPPLVLGPYGPVRGPYPRDSAPLPPPEQRYDLSTPESTLPGTPRAGSRKRRGTRSKGKKKSKAKNISRRKLTSRKKKRKSLKASTTKKRKSRK